MQIVMRFDMRGPDFGTPIPQLYAAALEMAEYGDAHGLDVVMLTEHHASGDGYLPAPTVLAGGMAARTKTAKIRMAAVVLPLHHPIAVAEQTLVLDQMSNGRVELAVAAGYVGSEFAMFGRDLRQRPRLMDEGLPLLGDALAGQPVTVDGRSFMVTPGPVQQPRPPLYVAGGVPATARRAARWGDGFYPLTPDPALRELYRSSCVEYGRPVGPVVDTTGPMFVHVADDPERAWDEIGRHALHELNSYGTWAAESTVGDMTSPFVAVEDVAAARACGLYEVVTVEGCLELMTRLDAAGQSFVLTPLLAGLSPETGWSGLRLFFEKVLPAYRAR